MKLTPAQIDEKQALTKTYEDALARSRATPSVANRQTAADASAALSAWTTRNDPPKKSSYASRAGQRQHAEMRAMYPSCRTPLAGGRSAFAILGE